MAKEDPESDYEIEESESDEEMDEEQKKEKRALKEVKMLRNKLRSFKTKEDNAKKERVVLKQQMKKTQTAIKEEKKKLKSLQKEASVQGHSQKPFVTIFPSSNNNTQANIFKVIAISIIQSFVILNKSI